MELDGQPALGRHPDRFLPVPVPQGEPFPALGALGNKKAIARGLERLGRGLDLVERDEQVDVPAHLGPDRAVSEHSEADALDEQMADSGPVERRGEAKRFRGQHQILPGDPVGGGLQPAAGLGGNRGARLPQGVPDQPLDPIALGDPGHQDPVDPPGGGEHRPIARRRGRPAAAGGDELEFAGQVHAWVCFHWGAHPRP